MVETLSEGHVVAEKSGLGTQQLHQFIEAMFPGPYTAYSNRMLSGDYYKREEPLFAVDLARKDARHAQKIANDAGVTMKNVQIADGLLQGVKEHMGTKGDIAGMVCRVPLSTPSSLETDSAPVRREAKRERLAF